MEESKKEELKKKKQKYSIEYKIHILDLINKGISYHTIENKMNLEGQWLEGGKLMKKNETYKK